MAGAETSAALQLMARRPVSDLGARREISRETSASSVWRPVRETSGDCLEHWTLRLLLGGSALEINSRQTRETECEVMRANSLGFGAGLASE